MALAGNAHGVVEIAPAEEKHSTQQALERLVASCPGTKGALVATSDGFVVAQAMRQEVVVRTLAAITSSVISLAESMVKETRLGPCQNLIIESLDGNVIALRINRTRVLTVIAEKKTRLGMLLSAAKQCVERLAKAEEAES